MEKSNIEFEGIEHLNQIRQQLWKYRDYGPVSVMVGAGFSKNAKPKSIAVKPYPEWADLSKKMIDELYHYTDIKEREILYHKAEVPSQILRLAYEYQTTFGSSSLDNFLISEIPDNDYLPGSLHKDLLELPWADIFTTNYDTLLERSLPNIIERKYNIILTMDDLPRKKRPRIVKLHGSFPSSRPFIITEEQYRRYPIDYAPFVNTIQQSLLETTFCMIGFSGDDPNFLAWTGWIRDNLGESAPPIYLIGLHEKLSSSQKRLLEKRRIMPINLSSIIENNPENHTKYEEAYAWFFNFLKNKPSEKFEWPYDYGFYHFPARKVSLDNYTHEQAPPMEEVKKAINSWEIVIENYPGWVFLPYKNRKSLTNLFSSSEYEILSALKNTPPPDDLILAYTYSWFKRKLLELFSIPLLEAIEMILNKYDPFILDKNKISPLSNPDFNWVKLKKYWMFVLFSLLEDAREEQDKDRFYFFLQIIDKVKNYNPEWEIEYYHQLSLYHLNSFSLNNLLEIVNQWEPKIDQPFGVIKKAAIIAEIGNIDEAKELTIIALAKIREDMTNFDDSYTLLSQEGLAMLLLGMMGNPFDDQDNVRSKSNKRWNELDKYNCNPHAEREYWGLLLDKPTPKLEESKEITISFDPGEYKRSILFSSIGMEKYTPAYSYLKFHDVGAIPVHCGYYSLSSSDLDKAINWIKYFHPRWALSMLARGENDRVLENVLTRSFILALEENHFEYIKNIFINSFKESIKYLSTRNDNSVFHKFYGKKVNLFIEIVSRLTIRMKLPDLQILFNLAISAYHLPFFTDDWGNHNSYMNLWKRLIYALPISVLLDSIDELLSLPVPGIDGFTVIERGKWKDPISFIEVLNIDKYSIDIKKYQNKIDQLINIANSNNEHAREIVLERLYLLYLLSNNSKKIEKKFTDAIWCQTDANDNFPYMFPFEKWWLLVLPHAYEYNVHDKLKNFVLNEEIKPVWEKTDNGWSRKVGSRKPKEIFHILIYGTKGILRSRIKGEEYYLTWSKDELQLLFTKIQDSWHKDKIFIEEKRKEGISIEDKDEDIRNQYDNILNILGTIIFPHAADLNLKFKDNAIALLDDFEIHGISLLSILPTKLFLNDPSNINAGYDIIAEKLRHSLFSSSEYEVRNAIQGIVLWKIYGDLGQLHSIPPANLFDELFNILVQRPPIKLYHAIIWIDFIIIFYPHLIQKPHIQKIVDSLEYLKKELIVPTVNELIRGNYRVAFCNLDEWPNYKAAVSRLVSSLYLYFKKKNIQLPDILKEWKEICVNDILPEVRHPWDHIVDNPSTPQ